MKTALHLCNASHHPDLQAAFNVAVKENPANAAITPSYLTDHQEPPDRTARIVASFT
ncbi:hypothetical protein [Pseudomonas sp. LS-2]|uniref:hypothetical protein n=1 Tax=Pseudomonas sp. LS-2 TaxID=2315859 RepID=UPI0021148776|nr:hypothetical protein [Pseudomonas sp. LS-2]